MTLGTRRIIYLSFIAIFLLIGAVLMFYATGYRLDLHNWRLRKVGIILLTSEQSDISIYLNNTLYPKKLISGTLSLNGLLPGDYLVRAEKDNYSPWQKKIIVRSGQTSFTEDVVLFRQSLPLPQALGKISWQSFSADKKSIVYLLLKNTSADLLSIDLASRESTLLYQLPLNIGENAEIIGWSAANKKILMNIKKNNINNYLILNIDKTMEPVLLSGFVKTGAAGKTHREFIGNSFSQVKWDNTSDETLYGLIANQLYQIDLAKKEASLYRSLEIEAEETINDFTLIEGTVYFVKTNILNSYLVKLGDKISFQIKLDRSPDYNLLPGNDQYLTVLEPKKGNLFLVNQSSFENIALSQKNNELIIKLPAKGAAWKPGSNTLLFYNDSEIFTYDLDKNEKNLVSRYGAMIKKADWYPNFLYIIALVDNQLKALEIYSQDKNIFDLLSLEQIDNFDISASGDKIFLEGKVGDQEGLYGLLVQEK